MYVGYNGKKLYGDNGYEILKSELVNEEIIDENSDDEYDSQGEIINSKQKVLNNKEFSEIHEFKKWFIVIKNKKYGFVDKKGNQLTDYIFEDYYKADFDDSYKYGSLVCNEDCHRFVKLDGLWGLIGNDGKFIIEPQFDDVFSVNPKGVNNCVGIGNKTRKLVKAPTKEGFDCGIVQNEGFGIVEIAILSCDGKYIIEPTDKIDEIQQLNDFNYIVEGFSDIKLVGKDLNIFKYKKTTIISGEFDKYDLVINGNEILIPRFDEIEDSIEGLCRVKFENKWGYINLDGEVAIEEKYDTATDFFYGCAIVSIANRYGVIDKTGEEIIKLQFNYATFDYDGNGGGLGVFIKVLLGTKEGYILNPGYNIKK